MKWVENGVRKAGGKMAQIGGYGIDHGNVV